MLYISIYQYNLNLNMLIVKVRKKNIERALKELKSKVIKTRQNSEINARSEYTKKSIKRRKEIQKATYIQKIKSQSII